MVNKILDNKYFWPVVAATVAIVVVAVILNKRKKKEQYSLYLDAIRDPSTITGEASDAAKYGNAFDPSYYKKVKGAQLLPQTSLALYTDKIHKADTLGPINDDAAVIDVFNKLTHKTQASQLADAFQQKYKQNLLEFLGMLKKDNLNLIIGKVNNLK